MAGYTQLTIGRDIFEDSQEPDIEIHEGPSHPNNPHNDESVYSDFKLLKHTDKLAEWQEKGYTSAPVILDLDLTDRCNHKCPLCIYGDTNTETKFIPTNKAKEILTDAYEMGSKAVTFAGGGDPTCHSDFEEIILHARSGGMETALFSNCYEMNDSLIETIVSQCTWMRVSLDADGPAIYKKTHGMNEEVFNQSIANVEKIIKRARDSGSDLVLGICYLIGPHTIPGIYNAAKLAKNLGAHAIRFRPFFNFQDHRTSIEDLLDFKSKKGKSRGNILDEMDRQLSMAMELKSKDFDVSYPGYRLTALRDGPPRGFPVCHYPHFSASITADMKLYPCCPLKGYEQYAIGDISKSSFKEVWLSPERRKVHEKIDFKSCPNPCQFDGHARLLYKISQSKDMQHKNFL